MLARRERGELLVREHAVAQHELGAVPLGLRHEEADAGAAAPLPPNASTSSTADFVYAATPTLAGQTGVKGFAGGGSGVICFDPQGADPSAGAVPLPITCTPI